MPLYESKCSKCGKVHEYKQPIAQMHETPICCKKKTGKVILTPIRGSVDTPAA